MPLTLRGARAVARRTMDAEIAVLWSATEAAESALWVATVESPGIDLPELPEAETFRSASAAFLAEAERRVEAGSVVIEDGGGLRASRTGRRARRSELHPDSATPIREEP